jgi:hypothetical protein
MKTSRMSAVFLVLSGLLPHLIARGSDEVTVDIRPVGSVPPVIRWYACVTALDGKPFDQAAAENCLSSIIAKAPFLTGKIQREGATAIVFNLMAPAVVLDKVEFEIPAELRKPLSDFVGKDSGAVRTDETYDYDKDSHTLMLFNLFLRSKGIRGIVSRDLDLNYDRGKAELRYRLLQGPPTFPREPLAPYGKTCNVMVRNFSEINIDDWTPLPLVEKYMRVGEKVCFSVDELSRSEQALRSTGLFKSLVVSVTEDGGWRDLALTVHTNETMVKQIHYKFYGLLPQSSAEHLPALPFWRSKPYSRSDALVTRDVFLKAFASDRMQVGVYEEDEMTDDGGLSVTFHVLGAAKDRITINGQLVEN